MIDPEQEAAAAPTPEAPGRGLAVLAVGLLAAVFAAFLVLGVPAQVLHAGFGLWFTEIIVFLALPWVVVQLTGRSPGALAFTPGFTWKLAAFGFAVGVFNWAAGAVPLMAASQALLPQRLVEMFDASAVFRDRAPGELFFIAAGASLAAPVCEEFFFRGVVQQGLMRAVSPRAAVVLTAFIFSAFHLDPVGFAARFELGLVFGLLAWKTRSIWPGVFAHAANNLTSTVVWLADPSAEDAPVDWSQVAPVVGVGAAVLAGLVLLARRFPSLLEAPTHFEEKPASGKPLIEVLAPWAIATVVGVGLLLAVDWRGVKLNTIDLSNPLTRPKKDASEADQAQWEALQALRLKARRAEVPMTSYEAARKAASVEHR